MENHFDRTIVFCPKSDFQNLYSWSLQEHDEAGENVGRDWIPWSWNLYFKARDISFRDHWRTGNRYPGGAESGQREIEHRRFIRASLYPDDTDRRAPTYSMLGTKRIISKFDLIIGVLDDDKQEHCSTDGIVSYTSEIDFRDVTNDDSLTIYFWLHKPSFDWYAEKVAVGQVDGLAVRLSGVKGFYSDWSPSITTDIIKVLTSDEDHKVEALAEGFPLPRLGAVNEAELYFVREAKLPQPVEEHEIDQHEEDHVERPIDAAVRAQALRDCQSTETLKLLKSLRVAAWAIAGLLIVLLITGR